MKLDEAIRERLATLVKMGEDILATKRPSKIAGADAYVDSKLAHQWATSSRNLLAKVFGKDSVHYEYFSTLTSKSVRFSPVLRAIGVLKAALDDYEGGYLVDVRKLVEAEVFDDFLEQAEHLLESGYHQAAAVIAGCVLEDGLRKLSGENGVPTPSRPKLDRMNADLAKAGVYNKLVQKRITVLADLRNKAAHGNWSDFTSEDVREMIRAVSRVLEEHFA